MYVINGIRDYIKDCWHDWLLNRLQDIYPNATIYFYDHGYDADFETRHWKEGSVWYYIRQRRIAKRMKHGKQSDVQSIK